MRQRSRFSHRVPESVEASKVFEADTHPTPSPRPHPGVHGATRPIVSWTKRAHISLAAVLSAIALAGCSAGVPLVSQRATEVPATETPVPSPTPLPAIVTPGPGASSIADLVLSDAANRLKVAPSDLRLVQADPRNWPDASLGCPERGVLYAQVVTPGYVMVVLGPRDRLEYHTDAHTHLALCLPASPDASPGVGQ